MKACNQHQREGGEHIATDKAEAKKSKRQKEWEEEPGWASVFLRPENEGNQPNFTGQGLDPAGDPIEVAVWIKRAKTGTRYLRVHIQPPYEAEGDDEDGENKEDFPF